MPSRNWIGEELGGHQRIMRRGDPLMRAAEETAKSAAVSTLGDLWKALGQHRKLGKIADVQSGIKWPARIPVDERYSDSPRPGLERGYGRGAPEDFSQYFPPAPVFLNISPVNRRESAGRNGAWN